MLKAFSIGTCGWSYAHWRRRFYPPEVKAGEFLAWYASRFNSVEVDYSFYRLPSVTSVLRWRDSVPNGFVFSLKAPRIITHFRSLHGVASQLQAFYRRTALLGECMGAHLFQLPSSFSFDVEHVRTLSAFIPLLDPDRHNVIEFRHAGWWTGSCYELLESHRVCFCTVDGFSLPKDAPVTARFAYFRFHGHDRGGYPEGSISHYANLMRRLPVSRIYAYFNNDAEARAVFNASCLAGLLIGEGRE